MLTPHIYTPNQIFDAFEITEIGAGIMYFVHNGRNAWHSTWVQKYSKECMHATLENAKKYCEENRGNGTVFYIIEMPTLVIRAGNKYALYVTQINAQNPLAGYSPTVPIENKVFMGSMEVFPCESELKIGGKLNSAALTFESKSRFWKYQPESSTPVLMLCTVLGNSPLHPLGGANLKSYKSLSVCSKYLLSWQDFKITRDCSGVLSILNDINGSASVTNLFK